MVYIISIIVIILDQLSKFLIVNNFYHGESRAVIENIFHLTFVKNRGAAFGILAGYRHFFIIITALIIVVLLIFRFVSKRNIYLDIAIALTIGGAIGNLIDRIRLAYVIDFLDFRIWPVFNLADTAIVMGMLILIYYMWKEESNNQVADTND